MLFKDYSGRIPADKFCPPGRNDTDFLYRERFAKDAIKNKNKKLTLIEGQPGQGKSILALQLVSRMSDKFSWYQIGIEDEDPILFLIALRLSIHKSLPCFESEKLDGMLNKNVVTLDDIPSAVNILLNDMDEFLEDDFYIVFDDTHLLENFTYTSIVLKRFINTSPPKIHFLITARKRTNIGIEYHEDKRNLLAIGNDTLSFTLSETKAFYNDILGLPYTTKQCKYLHMKTEGWIMGLIFATRIYNDSTENTEDIFSFDNLGIGDNDYIVSFFKQRDNFFQAMPEKLRRTLLKLSFLRNIPVDLAQQLSDLSNVESHLITLCKNNYFTRALSEDKTIFCFHHLFKEVLQSLALKELGKEEVEETLRKSALYFVEKKQTEMALEHYLKIPDFEAVEKILSEEGLYFIANNQFLTLLSFLQHIPENIIRGSAWFSMLFACCLLQERPVDAGEYFRISNKKFFEEQNRICELLTCAHLILFFIYIDSNMNAMSGYLNRGEELFADLKDELNVVTKIYVCQYLAMGHVFEKVDDAKVDYYLGIAFPLAVEHDQLNLVADMSATKIFAKSAKWKLNDIHVEHNKSYQLLFSHHVSIVNKMLLRLAQLDTLAKEGDFTYLEHNMSILEKEAEKTFLQKSIIGPVISKFNTDSAISKGNYEQALQYTKKGLEICTGDFSLHMQSIFICDLALIYSVIKNYAPNDIIEKGLRLRMEAGGKAFYPVCYLMTGASYTHCGNNEKALLNLEKAVEYSKRYDNEMCLAATYCYMACLMHRLECDEKLKKYLALSMSLCKKQKKVQFPGLTPDILKKTLTLAVSYDTEKAYAIKLLKEKFKIAVINPEKHIPLLKLRVLGNSSISLGENNLEDENISLGKSQREFLALLVSAPQHKLDKEQLTYLIWPDKDYSQARINFNTYFHRLKKELDKFLAPYDSNGYLSIEKGSVVLKNIETDVDDFCSYINKGLNCLEGENYWEAEGCFIKADKLWRGMFLSDIPELTFDSLENYRTKLNCFKIQLCNSWGRLLLQVGREDDAIFLLEDGLTVVANFVNEDVETVIKTLFTLYSRKNNTVQLKKLTTYYRTTLQFLDFHPDEIDEIIGCLPD